jgi:hypothetical protein
MNERGVSEAIQLAIFGWSSRKMIERYSHLGSAAKREAMSALSLKRPAPSIVPAKESAKVKGLWLIQ